MTTDESQDDRALLERFLAERSEDAFRALYRRHAPAVYGLILRLVGGCERDAEEALQETWIRAASRLGRFRWESQLPTWLKGIAVRCCQELKRRGARNRRDLVPDPETPPHMPPPVPGRKLDLERAIADLPRGFRQVLVLHDIEGYTHREIAVLLSIEPGTSKSQLARARRAMRARLHATPEDRHASRY